jgi:hypothetical protein
MVRPKCGTPLVKPEDFSKCSSHAFEKAIYPHPPHPIPKEDQENSVIFLE